MVIVQNQLLRSCDDRDFLSLSASRVFANVMSADDAKNADEQILASIVAAGESESGQACLRDLMVSFLAPKHVVGTRRTLLLSREVSENVAVEFPCIASMAHETAMQGAEAIWSSSQSELKKACALLAGLAMLITTGTGDDKIRRAVAFGGLVQLPFLECPLPQYTPSARPHKLIALVPSTRSWVVYQTSSSGKPVVWLSKRGLDGLCHALLLRQSNR